MDTRNYEVPAAGSPVGSVFAGGAHERVPDSTPAGNESDDPAELRRQRRVLIVDDEAAIRSLITTFLTRAGYEVDFAVDGQEAIEKLEGGERYDALVTDLMMPRVDGIGVVRFVQQTQPELLRRTIVLTAYPRLAESEAVDGVCAVIAKPFELVNLRSVLKSMFDK